VRTLLPAALASVPFGFLLVRVRVRRSHCKSSRRREGFRNQQGIVLSILRLFWPNWKPGSGFMAQAPWGGNSNPPRGLNSVINKAGHYPNNEVAFAFRRSGILQPIGEHDKESSSATRSSSVVDNAVEFYFFFLTPPRGGTGLVVPNLNSLAAGVAALAVVAVAGAAAPNENPLAAGVAEAPLPNPVGPGGAALVSDAGFVPKLKGVAIFYPAKPACQQQTTVSTLSLIY